MTQAETQLKRVHEKILLLMKQYQSLQKENERLKEDLKKMQVRNETVSLDAEKIRHQADVFKLSGRGLEESDKKMLEKRLNQYVREIDKCIALLHE
jgi:Zn-dependent oligopeptidase